MSHSDHAIRRCDSRHRTLMVWAMRIDRSFVGWGLFFILVGAIPLAVRGGALTADQVARLVAVLAADPRRRRARPDPAPDAARGARRLAGRDRDRRDGRQPARGRRRRHRGLLRRRLRPGASGRSPSRRQSGSLRRPRHRRARSSTAATSTRHDAGRHRLVRRGRGSDARRSGDPVGERSLAVRSTRGERGPLDLHRAAHDWRVGLPTEPRLDSTPRSTPGSSTFDLDGANLDVDRPRAERRQCDRRPRRAPASSARSSIEVNAGSLGADAARRRRPTGSIEVNAGSVELCAPPGVALRIQTNDSVVTSFDYDGPGPRPRRRRLGLARLRHGRPTDRPRHRGQRRLVHPEPRGGLSWLIGCTARATTGCWPASPVGSRGSWTRPLDHPDRLGPRDHPEWRDRPARLHRHGRRRPRGARRLGCRARAAARHDGPDGPVPAGGWVGPDGAVVPYAGAAPADRRHGRAGRSDRSRAAEGWNTPRRSGDGRRAAVVIGGDPDPRRWGLPASASSCPPSTSRSSGRSSRSASGSCCSSSSVRPRRASRADPGRRPGRPVRWGRGP